MLDKIGTTYSVQVSTILFALPWGINKGICMNKAKLIEQMAKMTKESKSTCKDCLEAFLNIVGKALKQGVQVALTGFGTFSVIQRQKRMGINPVTRKPMSIPAKKVPKFKPGKGLKELVE